MANITRHPFGEVASLRDEMDRFIARTLGEPGAGSRAWSPSLDVFEDVDAIRLDLDLPGMTSDQIEVEFDDNVLTISGERRFSDASADDRGSYQRVERRYGRFSRSVTLPRGVRADQIAADMRDGVLTVTVPKADEVKPRRIRVGATDAGVAAADAA